MAKDDISVLDLFRLDGRVAVVTGGSRGLGKSMALGLAQAGATTVICARSANVCEETAAEISKKTGGECIARPMDVTNEDEVKSVIDGIVQQFGHIDVLVNSAGINVRKPIEEFSFEEYERIVATNLTGTWLCCRAVARYMKERRYGSVINIGSALSAVGLAERTPYCSSKAAILGLTRTLALEWAPFGVRCNAICPGPFMTKINRPLLENPEKARVVVGRTAMNRWGELHEIRGAALFLASDASSYVTGTALFVDGGWTAQ